MVPEKKLPFSGGSVSLPVLTFGTKELRQCLRSRGRVHRCQREVKDKSWRAKEVLRDETLSKVCHLSLKTKSPYLGTERCANWPNPEDPKYNQRPQITQDSETRNSEIETTETTRF